MNQATSGRSYEVTFQVVAEDLVAYLRVMQRSLNTVGLLLGVALIALGVYSISIGDYGVAAVGIIGGASILIGAQTPLFDAWRARHYGRAAIGTKAKFTIGPTGIDVDNAGITAHMDWSTVSALRGSDRIVVFMRDRIPLGWIPATAFASSAQREEVEAFMRKQIAAAHTGGVQA